MSCARLGSAAVLSLVLVACGDDRPAQSTDDGTGSGTASTPTDSTDSTASSGAGTGVGTGDGTSSGAGTTEGGGVCTGDPGGSLFPLSVGRVLTYDASCVCDCDGAGFTRTITGTEMLGGREAFVVINECASATWTEHLAPNGAGVDIYDEPTMTWGPLLAEPIAEGTTWDYRGFTWTWTAAPEVTVAAGMFTDCWQAAADGPKGPPVHTYCPGVGPVSLQEFRSSFELRACDG